MAYININDAAALSGKSIQTIRRMIKAAKIKYRQEKTPQGFNYLIDEESLGTRITRPQKKTVPNTTIPTDTKKVQPKKDKVQVSDRQHRPLDESMVFFQKEAAKFTNTIDKLVEQNQKDKENFFKLISTFQDRVGVLENQIKMLEKPKSKWYQVWK